MLVRYPVFEDIKLQRTFTVVSANFYDWDTGELVESFQRAKIPTGMTREVTLDGSRRVGRNPVALVGAVPSRSEIAKNRWKSNGQRKENYYDSLVR